METTLALEVKQIYEELRGTAIPHWNKFKNAFNNLLEYGSLRPLMIQLEKAVDYLKNNFTDIKGTILGMIANTINTITSTIGAITSSIKNVFTKYIG